MLVDLPMSLRWILSSSSQTYYQIGAKVLQTHPKTNTKHMGNAFVLSINASFSIQCGGLRPALSSHLFVDLMGSNTWACHGVWWWIIRTWHVITWLHITVYCILPTYLYCSSYSIMGGPLFLPPAPLWKSWPWHRDGRIVGLQQPLDLPKACRLSDRPFAHAHAASQSLPSWHSPQPILSWNQAGTDWSLIVILLVLSTCIPY